MGVEPDWLQGAVRLSLSRYNSDEEVRRVSETVPKVVQRLQSLSALGKLGRQPASRETYQVAGSIGARR